MEVTRYLVNPSAFLGLPVVRVTFDLEAIDPVFLPDFAGSTFRGLLGHSLKEVACSGPRSVPVCENSCAFPERCGYAYLFETSAAAESGADCGLDRPSEEAPRPFVLLPPLLTRKFRTGERFRLGLTLLGRGCNYLSYFVLCFEAMARRGLGQGGARFRVISARAAEDDDPFYRGGEPRGALLHEPRCLDLETLAALEGPDEGRDKDPLGITFRTPIRLTYRGNQVYDPPFHVLIRALVRRLDLVMRLHGPGKLAIDFVDLIRQAQTVKKADGNLEWVEMDRYSNRQHSRHRIGGFIGRVAYDATARRFLPLLRAGTYAHVGKSTTFGFGAYVIGAPWEEAVPRTPGS